MNNINIEYLEKLISPYDLKNELNLKYEDMEFINESRKEINKNLNDSKGKMVVLMGPCSIHNYNETLEYANFIKEMKNKYKNILLIMRVYFEKPRTIKGWKGYLYDPLLNESNNIKLGLYNTRKLLIEITKMKIPIATEFLDTIIPQYIDDLISWGCIGARTVESQLHRQLASGLSMFIGFKNRTDGNIDIAINGMLSSREKHSFLGIDINGCASIIHTNGNKNNGIILRGSDTSDNINEDILNKTNKLLEKNKLNKCIIIDVSHGNTLINNKKDYKKQLDNINKIIELNKNFKYIKGIMIESNINEGKQNINDIPLKHGISITDGCINLQDSEKILIKINNII